MILNEIVDYLIFKDFIVPLGILIGGLLGIVTVYLIMDIKDKIKRRKKNRK